MGRRNEIVAQDDGILVSLHQAINKKGLPNICWRAQKKLKFLIGASAFIVIEISISYVLVFRKVPSLLW